MLNLFKTNFIKSFFFLSISIVLLYLATFRFTPVTAGDGPSYILTLWALSEHQSPDIRLEDAFQFSSFFPEQHFFSDAVSSIENNEPDAGWILHRNKNGDYYDHHFCFYPLICMPVKSILSFFKANQGAAFQITNVLIMILGLCYLLYFSSLLLSQRMALSQ